MLLAAVQIVVKFVVLLLLFLLPGKKEKKQNSHHKAVLISISYITVQNNSKWHRHIFFNILMKGIKTTGFLQTIGFQSSIILFSRTCKVKKWKQNSGDLNGTPVILSEVWFILQSMCYVEYWSIASTVITRTSCLQHSKNWVIKY